MPSRFTPPPPPLFRTSRKHPLWWTLPHPDCILSVTRNTNWGTYPEGQSGFRICICVPIRTYQKGISIWWWCFPTSQTFNPLKTLKTPSAPNKHTARTGPFVVPGHYPDPRIRSRNVWWNGVLPGPVFVSSLGVARHRSNTTAVNHPCFR